MEDIPALLREIHEEANLSRRPEPNLNRFRPIWEAYISKARRLVPDIHIEAGGEIVCLGGLSPGCQACKDGAWDCVFITMGCNLACSFCYSPHAIPADYAGSAFGATLAQVAANYRKTHITGISFSGGEPLLRPQELFAWVADLKSRCPDKYYWVYTNGLLANEEGLRRLGGLGVDEIRFNTAATNYDHPTVMRNLASAARFIPNVTVEIPAIPEHGPKLLSILEKWCALGVRFLNLHELMYEPGTNAATMTGARLGLTTVDGHYTEVNPESRALTLAVMKRIQDEGLPLSVNDCSLQSKLRQVRGRRRNLAPLTQAAHEKMVGDEVYETYCAYRDASDYRFYHPDFLPEMRQRYRDHRHFRLARRAPLSLHERAQWVAFEEIGSQWEEDGMCPECPPERSFPEGARFCPDHGQPLQEISPP